MPRIENDAVARAARSLLYAEETAARFAAQAQRLQIVVKDWKRRAEEAEAVLKKLVAEGESAETPAFVVRHVRSTKPAVIVGPELDVKALEERFQRQPPIELAKDVVCAALKAGEALDWARLEWSSWVEVKRREAAE